VRHASGQAALAPRAPLLPELVLVLVPRVGRAGSIMRRAPFMHSMPCEMCGKNAPLKPTIVEGSRMMLCPDCQKYGHTATKAPEVTNRSPVAAAMEARAKKSTPRDVYTDHPEALVEDYGARVKQARMKMGLTIDELASQIKETRNVVAKTEAMELHPSDTVVRKLERFLQIKLMGTPETTVQPATLPKKASGPLTLGDMLKDAIKKEEQRK
jgi:putative transcription factor